MTRQKKCQLSKECVELLHDTYGWDKKTINCKSSSECYKLKNDKYYPLCAIAEECKDILINRYGWTIAEINKDRCKSSETCQNYKKTIEKGVHEPKLEHDVCKITKECEKILIEELGFDRLLSKDSCLDAELCEKYKTDRKKWQKGYKPRWKQIVDEISNRTKGYLADDDKKNITKCFYIMKDNGYNEKDAVIACAKSLELNIKF